MQSERPVHLEASQRGTGLAMLVTAAAGEPPPEEMAANGGGSGTCGDHGTSAKYRMAS
jgi:hypothetical protein